MTPAQCIQAAAKRIAARQDVAPGHTPAPAREPFTPARAWLDRHPMPSDDVARIARGVIRDTGGDPVKIARWQAEMANAIEIEKRHATETADRARKGGAM
jgi:hypothetical protein